MNKFLGGLFITLGFIIGLSAIISLFRKPGEANDQDITPVFGSGIGFYIVLLLIIILSYFLVRTGIRLIRR